MVRRNLTPRERDYYNRKADRMLYDFLIDITAILMLFAVLIIPLACQMIVENSDGDVHFGTPSSQPSQQ